MFDEPNSANLKYLDINCRGVWFDIPHRFGSGARMIKKTLLRAVVLQL